jgi:anti-sigma factor RsiW
MSCATWEERVALFAGGDLETAEAAAVERHLSQCAACNALAADLRLELDGLRQVHAEPLAAGHYAAVRGRVLAELAKAPRQHAAWAWAAALAVAAAGACVVWVMMKPVAVTAPELPRLVAVAPTVQRSRAQRAPRQGAVTSAHVRRRRTERAAPSANEQRRLEVAEVVARPQPAPPAIEDSPVRMVQLATDDPNVVIYWLFEEKGEER